MVPASVNDKFVIRFCVVAQNATDDDIEYAWKTLSKIATDVIEKMQLLVISYYLIRLNFNVAIANLQKLAV